MGSAHNDSINIDNKNEGNSEKPVYEDVEDLEWSADQEILLLYSLHGCKPVGPNKHFRMLLIQERLSSALNKNIPAKAIWKKLNTLYDLEALDEAEAEADAAVAVETDFFLPEDEFGELMSKKLKEPNVVEVEIEKSDSQEETLMDIKLKLEEGEANEEEMESGDVRGKEWKKEGKRGGKKKDIAVAKDATVKKDNKEMAKRETLSKKDIGKEAKKGVVKETEKKNAQEIKKEAAKEQKEAAKPSKRESADKRMFEQTQKEAVVKKADQKKVVEPQKNQREATRPRAETPKLRVETKRVDAKVTRTETPKPQRVEALKKDLSVERKKDTPDKKAERKSPEKTPEASRSAKLRARDKKETEPDKSDTAAGSKRERSRDSTSKASDASSEEPSLKKVKLPLTKGRPTRNSLEQAVTPTAASPQKRRTRLL